jgi:transposase
MKQVAAYIICRHFDGIVATAQPCQRNRFIEASNGLFQAAKHKARGYTRFTTMRTVIFLVSGNHDFSRLDQSRIFGRGRDDYFVL